MLKIILKIGTRAEMVEEGAKVSQIIMWLLYWCIKPETSEINVTKAFPYHCKRTNIYRVSHVSSGNFGQPDHYWAVLKIFLDPEYIDFTGVHFTPAT